jgi:hypothetical protein
MRLRISLMALMAMVTAGTALPALAQDPFANGDFSSSPDALDNWHDYQIGNVTASGGYALFQEPAEGSLSQIGQDFDLEASATVVTFRYRFVHPTGQRTSAMPPT